MNIGMIISTPFPPEEGIGYYTFNLSKKLLENGHDVTVFTRGNISKIQKFDYEGINVYKPEFIPLYPFHVQIHRHYVEKAIKDIGSEFDLFHLHSPLPPPIKIKNPILGTFHTSLIEDIKHYQVNSLKSMGIKLLTHLSGLPINQSIIKHSKCITTVSTAISNELKQYYGVEKSIFVGNGVNPETFYPIKNKLETYVLFVGRLDYRKGLMDLLKASILLREESINIFIVGEGPMYPFIKDFIKRNKINNVFLMGHISGKELIELYQNALIFVFPSHYEGLPTVLLEAMACGLPIIASDIPSHDDLIKNGYNGILCKTASTTDLHEKIILLLNNQKMRDNLGKNARKTIKEKFTWDLISKKFLKIYNDLLE